MKISYQQIRTGLGQSPIVPTSAKLTQGFGLENTFPSLLPFYQSLGLLGHNGIDYGCSTGTHLKAPIDVVVTNFYTSEQDPTGYGGTLRMRSKEFTVSGKVYAVEIVFGHLSGFLPGMAIGKTFKQGEPCCISGNTGHSTGPHLHEGWRTVEKTSVGGWLAVDTDNGYAGYWNQLLLNIKSMKVIKGSGPHIYLVSGDGSKKIMLVDFPTYQALIQNVETVTDTELANYQDGGTFVWTDRIIN